MTVVLRGEGLAAADVVAVARRSAVVALGDGPVTPSIAATT